MPDLICFATTMTDILADESATKKLKQLVWDQWEEVDHRRKTSILDVDFSKYLELDALGVHYAVLAFDCNELIGYNSMLITESPHNRKIIATTDTIFIKKEYRKGGLGTQMIKIAEEEAKKRGASDIMVTFKNSDNHPEIVKELGFFSYETIYAKHIGG
jgi:GNAT superfamily N-acetyltransferase